MKKVKLSSLNVKSFVTEFNKIDSNRIEGGVEHDPTHSVFTENHYCADKTLGCCDWECPPM